MGENGLSRGVVPPQEGGPGSSGANPPSIRVEAAFRLAIWVRLQWGTAGSRPPLVGRRTRPQPHPLGLPRWARFRQTGPPAWSGQEATAQGSAEPRPYEGDAMATLCASPGQLHPGRGAPFPAQEQAPLPSLYGVPDRLSPGRKEGRRK